MDFKESLNELNQKLQSFSFFVVDKVKNFPNLTLNEQIGFGAIGGGIVLVLVAVVLFVFL
ncbi:MAG: hypothetical protein AABY26_05910 [Nanoarchaeota archaeon]